MRDNRIIASVYFVEQLGPLAAKLPIAGRAPFDARAPAAISREQLRV